MRPGPSSGQAPVSTHCFAVPVRSVGPLPMVHVAASTAKPASPTRQKFSAAVIHSTDVG
jgi:hypothetical protein